MAEKFSKEEAVRFGWEKMKSNLGFFVAILLILILVSVGFQGIAKFTQTKSPALFYIISIISWVVQSLITMGTIKIALKLCDNQKPEFSDLFSAYPMLITYLINSIIFGLIVLGGIILLIVPGIIFALAFQFGAYFIVDKKFGPIAALKKSAVITRGCRWNLFWFTLAIMGMNILGALALLVGLFATIPTSLVAAAFVYRKLLSQAENTQTAAAL